MKTSVSILGLLLFCLTTAAAPFTNSTASIRFDWDSTSDTNTAGWYLYWSSNTFAAPVEGQWSNRLHAATNSCTVSNLPLGAVMYFVLTAHNSDGLESDPSNEIRVNLRKPATPNLTKPALLVLETSPCVEGPWNFDRPLLVDASAPVVFWRLKVERNQ